VCYLAVSIVVDSDGCVHDGTDYYSNGEDCEFKFLGSAVIRAVEWDVEENSTCSWDWLEVNGQKYCGSSGFSTIVAGFAAFKWHTDGSVTKKGFKLCVNEWQ